MTLEKVTEIVIQTIIKDSDLEHKVFSCGGFIRDEILGIDSKDLDLVVNEEGGAKKLADLIHSSMPLFTHSPHQLGASYPIWNIKFHNNVSVDIADTQKESFPDEGSRQRLSLFGTVDEDIQRRDFTMNMLLRDLTDMKLIDKANGQEDIKNKLIRCHPDVSIEKILSDDPLRMIRCIRFAVKYGFNIDGDLFQAIVKNSIRLRIVSKERIHDELVKIMEIGKLDRAIKLLAVTGLLNRFLPEIVELGTVYQTDITRGIHLEGSDIKCKNYIPIQ